MIPRPFHLSIDGRLYDHAAQPITLERANELHLDAVIRFHRAYRGLPWEALGWAIVSNDMSRAIKDAADYRLAGSGVGMR